MDCYRRVAEDVSISIVLDHNVRLTETDLKNQHLPTLAEVKVIAGVKVSNSEPDRSCQLL
jgi:dihydrodipicolinate synthase/N-acetylneuraminate lyase